jgi:hypothetical protein
LASSPAWLAMGAKANILAAATAKATLVVLLVLMIFSMVKQLDQRIFSLA